MKRREYIPQEYQPLISEHVENIARCGVFARMGMGKTVSILTAVNRLWLCGIESRPALALAPLRVANSTWPAEVAKWEHLTDTEAYPIALSLDGKNSADADRRYEIARLAFKREMRRANCSLFTLNYENIPWLIEWLTEDDRIKWPFGTVIADESTRLKGYRSRQGGIRTRALSLVAHKTPRWINASGSPAPNGLKDLWGQTWYLDGGARLGSTYQAFSERWFYKTFDGRDILPHPFAQEQITDKLRDICVSLDPRDYFDIEEPIEIPVEIAMPEHLKKKYRELEREMFTQIEKDFDRHDIEALNAAARTQKCLQFANGCIYTDSETKAHVEIHDAKLDALESIIEEAAGMPVLVAYHFKPDLKRLLKRFPKGRALDKNPGTIEAWNAGRIPVLFAHPASAGHGLNLQDGGNILVFFSINWDLEHHEQIIERIGPTRQLQAGHKRPVFIYYITMRGTIERDVKRRLETKEGVQSLLMKALRAHKKNAIILPN